MPRQLRSLKGSNLAVLYTLMGFMVVVGLATLAISHAESVDYFDSADLHVSPLVVNTTLDRKNPNDALMIKDKAGYTAGLIYGPGFTITDKTATSYQVRYTSPTSGVGFYESSGGLDPGQSVKIHTYVNPSLADGTYSGSANLFYYAPDQNAWVSGPTITYSIHLVDYVYTDYLTVSTTAYAVTLSREAKNSSGLIFGPGPIVTSVGAGGFEFKYNEPTGRQGFYPASGGMVSGQTINIQSYINPDKPNGIYTGTAVLEFYAPDKRQWLPGPTVTYSINLVDSYYTDFLTVAPLSVNVTLHRSNANPSGLILGTGMTISDLKAGGYEFRYAARTVGQGFYQSSGGLVPGHSVKINAYINKTNPNGTYRGTAILQYYNSQTAQWIDGPTVLYSITLTN
jgi:hypothetical protein